MSWAISLEDFLSRYFFVNSNYLRTLFKDGSVVGQQRLALYQLLQFVHSQLGRPAEAGVGPKLSLLRYIKRLEVFGEERQLRQVPAWADGIDAVRLLTIHASKGLEFRAVFLPVLATSYLPIKKGYAPCPPPEGMISEGGDWRIEEEECLFFVAMSRARSSLPLPSGALRKRNAHLEPFKLSVLDREMSSPYGQKPGNLARRRDGSRTDDGERDGKGVFRFAINGSKSDRVEENARHGGLV